MRKQINSFRCALRGIWNTIKSESHMRFHLVAGFYVLLFSQFYDFSAVQIAILVILIASVMVAEIFNTCIEELGNLAADHYEPLIRSSKDAAAGAVFVISVAAVIVAVVFFWDISVFLQIFNYFANNIVMLVLFVLSAILCAVFVWLGPAGIKEKIIQHKLKTKK